MGAFPLRTRAGALCCSLLIAGSALWPRPQAVSAAPSGSTGSSVSQESRGTKMLYAERRDLYEKVGLLTGIPWYELAAVDQYERTINQVKKRSAGSGPVAVYFTEAQWGGLLNPDPEDRHVDSIRFFGGLGRDGSGDGLADRGNDLDRLYSIAAYLAEKGTVRDDFKIGLWEYYQNNRSVERIEQFSKIYARFGTLDLDERRFIMPLNAEYTYRSTWGASRAWGGARIHEGTDIFAGYGVPVRAPYTALWK
ncbi:hypothetical protein LJK88_07170 [Paenibacillus sp. P26]|nr:hypothetical protein LJK88_07170 [Paenibacillus sp. P26]